ncbi:MAG: hypothetical protein ACLR0F_25930 [Eisenbergiella sp.]
MIPMDATLIEQVLVNLLKMRCFMRKRGSIECRAEIGKDNVTFLVTDQEWESRKTS